MTDAMDVLHERLAKLERAFKIKDENGHPVTTVMSANSKFTSVLEARDKRIAELEAILDDWVKCAISVEIRDYGQPGYEEAMKAFRKARRATYKYERERNDGP
jgi:hypothetical protein